MAKRYLTEFWMAILLSGVWGLVLFFLGLLEIEPMALRLAIWPTIGIPGTLYTVWEAHAEGRSLPVGEYALNAFFAAPALALFVAIAMGGVLYALIEGARVIIG